MNPWDNLNVQESSQNEWDLLTTETPIIADQLDFDSMDNEKMNNALAIAGVDPKIYTKDDEVYEVKGEEDKVIKYGDMNLLDKGRANLNDFTTDYLGFSTQDKKVGVVDGKREEMKDKIINDMDNIQTQEYLGLDYSLTPSIY